MKEKTCCITGHREIPVQKIADIERALRQQIQAAIAEGYTRFLSGFAEGADLLFAAIVAEQKKCRPDLYLEAVIPYAGRMKTKNPQFHELLQACNRRKVICSAYVPGCFQQRNRYLVEQSQRVIAVYDGRYYGGTRFTMGYAYLLGREVRGIKIEQGQCQG